jgi:methyl-accepting chemotaxis protein/integral membrane sensor domain MASE1
MLAVEKASSICCKGVGLLPVAAIREKFTATVRQSTIHENFFLLVLTVIFTIVAKLSLKLALPLISPVWPPAGIALAAVLWKGYSVWPALFFGTIFGSIPAYHISALLGVGVVIQAFTSKYFLNKIAHTNNPFEGATQAVVFIVFSALLACAINPILGTIVLTLSKSIPSTEIMSTLFTFWIGDAMGTLIFAPSIMAWYKKPFPTFSSTRCEELVLFVFLQLMLSWIIFIYQWPVAYLLIPFPILATMRFGQQIGTLSGLTICGCMLFGSLHGYTGLGDAYTYSEFNIFFVQSFVGILFFPLLILTGLLNERQKAYDEMENRIFERTKALDKLIQLRSVGDQLNDTSQRLAKTAKDHEATAIDQEVTTRRIAQTAKEISDNIQRLALTMADVSDVAKQTSTLAQHGRVDLKQMETIVKGISKGSSEIRNELEELNTKAGGIALLIITMVQVSDRTNLLSLNAELEASSANGKGFGVIATEIRKLANETASATLKIEKIIKEMIDAVASSVFRFSKFSDEISLGLGQTNNIYEKLSQIIDKVEGVTNKFSSVNQEMQAQALGADRIRDDIRTLSEYAQSSTHSIRELNSMINSMVSSLAKATVDRQDTITIGESEVSAKYNSIKI